MSHLYWMVPAALGVGVAGLLAATFSKGDKADNFAVISLAGSGTSLGLGLVARGVHAKAARQYNEDLRAKFSPSVAASFDF